MSADKVQVTFCLTDEQMKDGLLLENLKLLSAKAIANGLRRWAREESRRIVQGASPSIGKSWQGFYVSNLPPKRAGKSKKVKKTR